MDNQQQKSYSTTRIMLRYFFSLHASIQYIHLFYRKKIVQVGEAKLSCTVCQHFLTSPSGDLTFLFHDKAG